MLRQHLYGRHHVRWLLIRARFEPSHTTTFCNVLTNRPGNDTKSNQAAVTESCFGCDLKPPAGRLSHNNPPRNNSWDRTHRPHQNWLAPVVLEMKRIRKSYLHWRFKADASNTVWGYPSFVVTKIRHVNRNQGSTWCFKSCAVLSCIFLLVQVEQAPWNQQFILHHV